MIQDKYKLIFVHIPKNAGTSVERFFDHKFQPGSVNNPFQTERVSSETEAHLPARLLKRSFPDVFDDYLKFCIVRNPFGRMVSAYQWLRRVKGLPNCSFAQWVNQDFPDTPQRELNIFIKPTQLDWFTDEDGSYLVDHVLRFEALRDEFEHIRQYTGASRHLPHKNRTNQQRSHYSMYYDDESIERISALYESDIDHFGYKFEDQRWRARIRELSIVKRSLLGWRGVLLQAQGENATK